MPVSFFRVQARAMVRAAVGAALAAVLLVSGAVDAALAATETPSSTEPTVVELPSNFGGLSAQGFYIVGGLLLVGGILLVLLVTRRGRRR